MAGQRLIRLLMVSAALSSLASVPALAQLYPGEDVMVNPAAIPPTASPYVGRIVLHRPQRHHPRAVASVTPPADTTATPPADTATPPADTATPAPATETPPSPPPAKPKHRAPAASSSGVSSSDSSLSNFEFGGDEFLGAPSAKVAKAETPQSATPARGSDSQAGLSKPAHILFEHDATDPQPSQIEGIKLLATDLNSALEGGATQIQLQAFGGAPGDKSSDARRISLRRALAIRQILIDNGVPAGRIVTRAMGGATDGGQPDRVDVYVRAS